MERRVHLGGEERVAVLAGGLHVVHRDVGVLEQRVGILAVGGIERYADAGGGADLVAGDIQRPPQLLDYLLGNDRGVLGLRQLGQQDGELVPAHAGQRVAAAQTGLQARGHALEQLVALGMAEGVVDQLEAIEVDEQQRDQAAIAPRRHQRDAEPVEEQRRGWEDG